MPIGLYYSQFYFQKYLILVVLLYSQIPFSNPERRVVVDLHENNRVCPRGPGVVAKGLAQRMTGDIAVQMQDMGGLFDDAECLVAG